MNRQRGLVAIHVAAVLFGLTGIFGELIQANAMVITAGRASFAVIVLYAFIRYQGASVVRGVNKRNIVILAVAGAMLTLHWTTFFVSVKVGGVAVATLGFASFPAFITLSEYFIFKEKVQTTEWLILALVSVGLILVTPTFSFHDHATVGLAWGIASGMAFAAFTLINRRAAADIPAQQVACWENLFVVLLTLPFSFPAITQLDALNWLWLGLLGVFCTALSHYLLVSGLSVVKARSAGIIIALEPVYAIFFAAVLFAQYPSIRALIGGTIMIAAIVWSGLRRTDPPASATAH